MLRHELIGWRLLLSLFVLGSGLLRYNNDSIPVVSAHESCCMKKLKQQEAAAKRHLQAEFIPDPNDTMPPDVHNGIPRLIVDPNVVKPSYWDDEDDGEWEPDYIENPNYSWQPRMIRNPNYTPPPKYYNELYNELHATIPWVLLGVFITAILSMIATPVSYILGPMLGGGGTSNNSKHHDSLHHRCWTMLKSSMLGLATPLCSCGALPLVAGFIRNDGVPISTAAAFLTASQSAGLDSAAITWGLLGPTAALCRLIGAIIIAIAVGISLPTSSSSPIIPKKNNKQQQDKEEQKEKQNAIKRLFVSCTETAYEVFPSVFLGIAISTAIVHYIPSFMDSYRTLTSSSSSSNSSIIDNPMIASILIRLLVLLSATPLQLCEHSTVALAAGIQKAGGSAGLAFAFLLSAPATNLPSLLLLLSSSSTTTTTKDRINSSSRSWFVPLRISFALVGTALVLSYLVDALGIDLYVSKEAESGGSSMPTLPQPYVNASPYTAGILFTTRLITKNFNTLFSSKNHNKLAKNCSTTTTIGDDYCHSNNGSSSCNSDDKKNN